MALGISALSPALKSSMANLNVDLGQLRENYILGNDLYSTASAEAKSEMDAMNNDDEIINKNLLDVTTGKAALTNPLTKMYTNVHQFVITNQGMCGMGMGMGKFSKDVNFSGGALIATSTMIAEQDGGISKDWDGIAAKLKESGIDAKVVDVEIKDEKGNVVPSASKKGIEITNKDGSKTTVCDTNGNGGLDKGDYDFSDALKSFNTDLTKYTADIKAIEDKAMKIITPAKADRDTHYNKLKGLGVDMEKIDAKLQNIDKDIAKVETDVANLQTISDVSNETQAKLEEQKTLPVAGSTEKPKT